MTPTPCRMGDHCATRTHTGPGPAIAHDLCAPDELHGRAAITRLPTYWSDLTDLDTAGKDAGRQGMTGLRGARSEPPIPLRTDVDELARRIAWTLGVWELAVRDVAHLSQVPEPRFTYRDVARAAGILDKFYPVLLSLGPTDYIDYDTQQPVTHDGPAAVVALADTHRQARAALGMAKRREHRDLPCPAIPCETHTTLFCQRPGCANTDTGCGLYTLGWTVGADEVDCRNCGWTYTLDDYATYARTFVPPTRNQQAAAL